MNIISALGSGSQALYQANQQLDQSAQQIARQPLALQSLSETPKPGTTPSQSLSSALIEQTEAKTYALTGVKVIQSVDAMLGTLLDINA